jgi:hypothetical protein
MTRPTASHRGVVPESVTVEIPLTFKKRGGRKQMITPDGSCVRVDPGCQSPTGDNAALVRALARAYRWQWMLESGSYGSITELAEAERVNRSYLCRVLRLTLLAPEIVHAMSNGSSATLPVAQVLQPFEVEWNQQRQDLLMIRVVQRL